MDRIPDVLWTENYSFKDVLDIIKMILDIPVEINIDEGTASHFLLFGAHTEYVSLCPEAATIVGLRRRLKYEEADMHCRLCWRVVRGVHLMKEESSALEIHT
ncbi:hypothetical protein FOXB_02696 [Fusarium oxysporum f. sp. conglutinans Fo5176]|uniref:Uncharacterized protein n=1 Tax=Fusarium oxysporum (strain Fo5176) TaxID=660025 RepID=F9F8H1_FUSOF|nr:hypothetical protein FOXB_02696 [Fusarium oxysporum f. sp. conglutinans Fo5176]